MGRALYSASVDAVIARPARAAAVAAVSIPGIVVGVTRASGASIGIVIPSSGPIVVDVSVWVGAVVSLNICSAPSCIS